MEEKIFKPSLFRKNPEVPKLKSSNAVEPVIEQLFSSKLFQDSNFHPHMVYILSCIIIFRIKMMIYEILNYLQYSCNLLFICGIILFLFQGS